MLWRHRCLVRALSAAGLLIGSTWGVAAFAEPEEPAPGPEVTSSTVGILEAQREGQVAVRVRGQGSDQIRVAIHNTSPGRLNIVIPPGLVGSITTGQMPGQSIGISPPTNRVGAFGQFRAADGEAGFRSLSASGDLVPGAVAVPAGKTIDLTLPGVCLNFGLRTPTAADEFELMDVEQYTNDPRVRKALRSLATLGTTQPVAQAAMWRVCNGVPFEVMAAKHSKAMNVHEIALASRFVEALDASGSSELVDPAYLTEARLFVQIQGEGPLAAEAKRLGDELDGLRLMGLPVRVVDAAEVPKASSPAMLLRVTLTGTAAGETRGRVVAMHSATAGKWQALGKTAFVEGSSASVLDAPALAKALDRAVASQFVSARPIRRAKGNTVLKVENRLPFTLANVMVKAGESSGAPIVTIEGLGVGPARSATAPIQAATGVIERVELNGL
jgi:hypothetical protein